MKQELTEQLQPGGDQREEQEDEENEEGDLDVTIEGAEEDEEEEEISELWDTWDGELSLSQPDVQVSEDQRKRGRSGCRCRVPPPHRHGELHIRQEQPLPPKLSILPLPVCGAGWAGRHAALHPSAEDRTAAAEEGGASGEADGV